MQVLQHTHSPGSLGSQARLSRARSARLVPRAASGGQQNGSNNERNNYNVRKGKQFENSRRRRGRPAHLRSPYDSPLRDGNRDRLIGLLTERAAKTLMVYLMETNANVYSWLVEFYKKNPIPKNGSWDEVSGEAFLRKLLSMPIEEAKFNTGRDSLFDNVSSCGVDPRSIAQRIMDIRTQLSEEFIQELQAIAEENSLLLRETLATSLSTSLDDPPAAASSKDGTPVHPELAESPPPSTTASSSNKDGSSSSTSASKGSSSSGGAVSTPPPSPTPAAPKRTPEPIKGSASNSSSSSKKDAAYAADTAAAVAALNAALSKPPVAGAGSTTSSSSSGEEKVDMADVLAQLRRAMEADVARDVMKMKENTTSSSSSSSSSDSSSSSSTGNVGSNTGEESGPAAPPAPAAEAAAEAAAAPEAPSTDSLSPEQPPAPVPVPTAGAPGTPAPVAAAEPVAAAADSSGTPEAAAAATASQDEDSSSSSVVSTQLSSSAVGEAGTYSRMLPKGWGPRLGVGFSRYPRSRNNIVSSANLGALKPPGAAGDAAVSGRTAASETV